MYIKMVMKSYFQLQGLVIIFKKYRNWCKGSALNFDQVDNAKLVLDSQPGWEKTRNRAGAWTDYLQNCPRDFENWPRALIRRPEGPVLLEARGKNFFDF